MNTDLQTANCCSCTLVRRAPASIVIFCPQIEILARPEPGPCALHRLPQSTARVLAPRRAARCTFPTSYFHEGDENPGNKEHCPTVIGGPERTESRAEASCMRGEGQRRIELPSLWRPGKDEAIL